MAWAPKRALFYSDMSEAADRPFPVVVAILQGLALQSLGVVHVLHFPNRFRAEVIGSGIAMNMDPEIMAVAERPLGNRYRPMNNRLGGC